MGNAAASALVLIGLAVLGVESMNIEAGSAAALYPRVLIGAGFLLLLGLALASLRRGAGQPANDTELSLMASGPAPAAWRFALFCAIWIAYPLAMSLLGFTAATTLALWASSLLASRRRPWLTLLALLVFTVAFAVALKTVIYVPVPAAWPDQLIDAILYRY